MRGTSIEDALAKLRTSRTWRGWPPKALDNLRVGTIFSAPYDYWANNTLITTTTGADQLIYEYRSPAGAKRLKLLFLYLEATFTVVAAAATILGNASLQTSLFEKIMTRDFLNPTTSAPDVWIVTPPRPIPLPETKFLRLVCTPAVVTSITWRGAFVVATDDL